MTLHINPYFDPDPKWLFITFKVNRLSDKVTLSDTICSITSLLYITVLHYFFKVSTSKTEKLSIYVIISCCCVSFDYCLNEYNSGMFWEAALTILMPPLLYLPYVGAEYPGLFTSINVPEPIQCALLINLFIGL